MTATQRVSDVLVVAPTGRLLQIFCPKGERKEIRELLKCVLLDVTGGEKERKIKKSQRGFRHVLWFSESALL